MRRFLGTLWVCIVVGFLAGCAHPVSLSSNTTELVGTGPAPKIDRKLGLLIAPDLVLREFVSPGGGGDKISYFPYRDLETGLYVALSEVFVDVRRVRGPQDPVMASENIGLILRPDITTSSSSSSLLTWPPTYFSITLALNFTDRADKPVTQLTVQGEGRAEFAEFKGDLSLAAKRAAGDVLKKLMKLLSDSRERFR